jgi:hypothetical protein
MKFTYEKHEIVRRIFMTHELGPCSNKYVIVYIGPSMVVPNEVNV